ncbi:hypothetical protein NEMIN01_1374 [Nematocida minor]|uniref:uncharacterized protein n=1 Tax=Nematocida minor TaxID=1912983 RepID=UPI00221E5DB6|nr:uncharacterized protein NEMIN01_1374 [Nematocida minor]KAI5191105.1 hypothetical protein NEMIN01_1374 [Nematocida minor]
MKFEIKIANVSKFIGGLLFLLGKNTRATRKEEVVDCSRSSPISNEDSNSDKLWIATESSDNTNTSDEKQKAESSFEKEINIFLKEIFSNPTTMPQDDIIYQAMINSDIYDQNQNVIDNSQKEDNGVSATISLLEEKSAPEYIRTIDGSIYPVRKEECSSTSDALSSLINLVQEIEQSPYSTAEMYENNNEVQNKKVCSYENYSAPSYSAVSCSTNNTSKKRKETWRPYKDSKTSYALKKHLIGSMLGSENVQKDQGNYTYLSSSIENVPAMSQIESNVFLQQPLQLTNDMSFSYPMANPVRSLEEQRIEKASEKLARFSLLELIICDIFFNNPKKLEYNSKAVYTRNRIEYSEKFKNTKVLVDSNNSSKTLKKLNYGTEESCCNLENMPETYAHENPKSERESNPARTSLRRTTGFPRSLPPSTHFRPDSENEFLYTALFKYARYIHTIKTLEALINIESQTFRNRDPFLDIYSSTQVSILDFVNVWVCRFLDLATKDPSISSKIKYTGSLPKDYLPKNAWKISYFIYYINDLIAMEKILSLAIVSEISFKIEFLIVEYNIVVCEEFKKIAENKKISIKTLIVSFSNLCKVSSFVFYQDALKAMANSFIYMSKVFENIYLLVDSLNGFFSSNERIIDILRILSSQVVCISNNIFVIGRNETGLVII